jgi:hypothetical protein
MYPQGGAPQVGAYKFSVQAGTMLPAQIPIAALLVLDCAVHQRSAVTHALAQQAHICPDKPRCWRLFAQPLRATSYP